MNNVNFSDYTLAGYVVTAASRYRPGSFLPLPVVSLSKSIASFFPDSWAIEWCNAPQSEIDDAIDAFKLHKDRIPELRRRTTELFEIDFGYPNVCFNLQTAKKFHAMLRSESAIVLGIGMNGRDAEKLLTSDPSKTSPSSKFAPIGKPGIITMLSQKQNIDHGGPCIGFDVVEAFYGLETSWLTTDFESYLTRKQLRLNENGLFSSAKEAINCAADLNNSSDSKQGVWVSCMVVKY